MANKPSDDPKVMDVSKPGKGKIVINSRPVVAPVVNDKASDSDVSSVPEVPVAEPAIASPSATRKVIKPINIDDSGKIEDGKPETNTKPEPVDNMPEAEEPAQESETTVEEVPEEPEAVEKNEETTPESTDNLPTPKTDNDSSGFSETSATDSSGAASVDEMAKAAEAKRMAGEKSKEEAERDQKAQELIKSKQYFVPISHASHSSKKTIRNTLIALILVAALGGAGYFAYTAGLFGNTTSDSSAPTNTPSSNDSDTENTEDEATNEDTVAEDIETSLDALAKGNDEDRKNELKNLQQKLETYYNDNGEYPASLSDFVPSLTEDEITGPKDDAYTYAPADKDGVSNQVYTLSAVLENPDDPDAVEGVYSIQSVNQ